MGVIEGITEFLPISSTGHLIVGAKAIGFSDTGGTFEIVIQLGAVLAVLWFYRVDLWRRLRAVRSAPRFWINLVVAVIPAVIVGLLFGDAIKEVLFNPVTVAVALIAGGIVLWWVETRPHPTATGEVDVTAEGIVDRDQTGPLGLDAITTRQAAAVGLFQLTALVPGVSRAGSTIVGGMLSGLDRETATAFSFYLALPTLGGATLYDLLRNLHQISTAGMTTDFVVGTVTAFVVALFSIGWLLRYIAHHDFKGFAVYRVLAGALILVLVAVGFL